MWALFILVPLVVLLVSKFFRKRICWKTSLAQFGVTAIVALATLGIIQLSTHEYSYELLNGTVISKERIHDYWLESYDCNCVTTCTGGKNSTCTTTCQTCYRDHYTVDWVLSTTLGSHTIDSLDWESKSVYNEPNPLLYDKAYIGQPYCKTNRYRDYVKAAKNSLFMKEESFTPEDLVSLPAYPSVFNQYYVNRISLAGVSLEDYEKWNTELSKAAAVTGDLKQANLILVLVDSAKGIGFRNILETVWTGGRKNDVILLLGINDKEIAWSDVITFGQNIGNELMTATMTTAMAEIGTIEDMSLVIATMRDIVVDKFDRYAMQNFEYLQAEVAPPTSYYVWGLLINLIASIGLAVFINREGIYL